MIRVINSMWAD